MPPKTLYQEKWTVPFYPLVFLLPCFYTYNVILTEDELIFGYGIRGPWKGVTAHRVPRRDIQRFYSGTWNWKDNLKNLGGFGIRYGRIASSPSDHTEPPKIRGWAYNASNGPFIVIQMIDQKFYQFVTKNPDTLVELLTTTSEEYNQKFK